MHCCGICTQSPTWTSPGFDTVNGTDVQYALFLPLATYSFFKHLLFMFTPYYSQSSLVQLLGSWAPNPRVVGSIPWPGPCCCDLKQVTLSLLLQRTCASAVWLHGLSLYNYGTTIRCCNYNITPTSNPESLHYYAVCILYLIYSW